MTWTEFSSLVAGLMEDTPLGRIISIRSEKDPKKIKQFSSSQRAIHSEWKNKTAQALPDEQIDRELDSFVKQLEKLFGPNSK